MKSSSLSRKSALVGCRGQSLVEFAMITIMLLMLVLAVVEFGRIVLCYTTIANAARVGSRYAITHSTIPGGANPTNTAVGNIQSAVTTAVDGFLHAGTVNPNTATVNVTFPDASCSGTNPTDTCSGTTAGNRVKVTVSYLYNPLMGYLNLGNIHLSSTSEGVITW